jgi:hypothetical protein
MMRPIGILAKCPRLPPLTPPAARAGGPDRAMQGSREFVLRLEGILPTGLCLSFGFLFFGLFSYAAFFGPPVAQQTASCAGAAAKSSLLLSRLGLELASNYQVGIGQWHAHLCGSLRVP